MKLSDLASANGDLRRRCGVCAAMEKLDAEAVAALDTVLRNSKMPYTMIAEALHDEGYPGITDDTVGKHAKGKCKARIRYRD